jgi:N-acetylneuraminate synthase
MEIEIPLKFNSIRRGRSFIVAEIGINHNGDLSLAEQLIRESAGAGADAVKFQKRTPEECVPLAMRKVERDTPWGRMTYMEYRERMEFNFSQYKYLQNVAESLSIDFFVTPWDKTSLRFLEQLEIPCIKIASASVTDLSLIKEIAKINIPVVMSTGMSTLEEIDRAVQILNKVPLVVVHSTSAYPCKVEELNLSMIKVLEDRYQRLCGYSGHETGIPTSLAAAVLGATYIERHITLDRSMMGSDHSASLEPHGFKKLVRDIRVWEAARGDGIKRVYESELPLKEKLRIHSN